jgi:hypothetical protein
MWAVLLARLSGRSRSVPSCLCFRDFWWRHVPFLLIYDVEASWALMSLPWNKAFLWAIREGGIWYLCSFTTLSSSPVSGAATCKIIVCFECDCHVTYRSFQWTSAVVRLGSRGPLSRGWIVVPVRLHSCIYCVRRYDFTVYIPYTHEQSRVVTCCVVLLLDVVHSAVLVRARHVKPVLCNGDLFFLLLCLFRHLALLKAWSGYHWAFSRSLILRPNSWPSTRSHNNYVFHIFHDRFFTPILIISFWWRHSVLTYVSYVSFVFHLSLVHIHNFAKMNIISCGLHALCLWFTLSTFECRSQSLWNLVCTSGHLSPSQRLTWWIPLISMCVYMCIPSFIARQRFVKHVPAATNTQAIIEELLDACVCESVYLPIVAM